MLLAYDSAFEPLATPLLHLTVQQQAVQQLHRLSWLCLPSVGGQSCVPQSLLPNMHMMLTVSPLYDEVQGSSAVMRKGTSHTAPCSTMSRAALTVARTASQTADRAVCLVSLSVGSRSQRDP